MKIKLSLAGVLLFILSSCDSQTGAKSKKLDAVAKDSISHGYNELANPEDKKQFPISDFNTDNQEIRNIDRPKTSIIKTKLDTALLFGVWTSDPNGPHADFELNSKFFFVVDYDGDGDMPYELSDNKLRIYYNDFIQEGKIIYVGKDTLEIMWKDFDKINKYVRWTQ